LSLHRSKLTDMKALVLGATGQLGWQCMKDLPAQGVEVRGLDRSLFDVSKGSASQWSEVLGRYFREFNPDWVINAIAYTAVDRAEDEPHLAMRVNGEFPGFLADAMRKLLPQSRLLHCSSDYVFDGGGDKPFQESDATDPLSVYGKSKLEGERAAMAQGDHAWVLRFSWVVGEHGQNFAKTMLRLACERAHLGVVGDQYGVPSPTPFLVREFVRLMMRLRAGRGLDEIVQKRLFHVVPAGQTTWFDYARCCLAAAAIHPLIGCRLKLSAEQIESIQTKDYPTKAVRPKNSRLDCSAWCKWHGMEALPSWEQETMPVIRRILEQAV
jgi:dTDP-4-dehydrorhamnose reductase